MSWPFRIIGFLLWYAKEFLLANLSVTADVLRPRRRMKMRPAIVAVPAASRTDSEWTLISSLITLTPGTLTITLSREHGILYVHGMFVDSREQLVAEIQEMEDRLLHAMRREPGDLSRPTERPVVRPLDEAAPPSATSERTETAPHPPTEAGENP
ncbi:Na+/H+ antiporter subunit E [Nesterenkonia halotolerans]|uniref:Multicomponent Na+:H+ antiporter subunit E n=1 Tax=Nesterenkonia halotolerans TaxID=225325 RepID=A0ABR9J5F4_9MICC|nr:Na+/H+ antiporter subunit E [Nesterenkonia halotolerans]MBE1514209.1 multicomponent Na+:H+ antiporter subunit E [Nesterenkonia halotolerans]